MRVVARDGSLCHLPTGTNDEAISSGTISPSLCTFRRGIRLVRKKDVEFGKDQNNTAIFFCRNTKSKDFCYLRSHCVEGRYGIPVPNKGQLRSKRCDTNRVPSVKYVLIDSFCFTLFTRLLMFHIYIVGCNKVKKIGQFGIVTKFVRGIDDVRSIPGLWG